MTLHDDIRAYQARWDVVEDVIQQERRSASVKLRWNQLNSAYGLAKALGLLRADHSEAGVFERWAKLKEKAAKLPPKAVILLRRVTVGYYQPILPAST